MPFVIPGAPMAFVAGVESFAELGRLEGARDRAAELATLLARDLGLDVSTLLDPTADELRRALELAQESSAPAVLVHIMSHGQWEGRDDVLWIAGAGCEQKPASRSWVHLRAWLSEIANDPADRPPVVVVLDVCSAGTAAAYEFLRQHIVQSERRVYLIGATRDREKAYDFRFSVAFRATLANLVGGKVNTRDEFLSMDLLVSETWQALRILMAGDLGNLPQELRASSRDLGVTHVPPLFRNPHSASDPLTGTSLELREMAESVIGTHHFLTRATGSASAGMCCFNGRSDELTSLAGWMNAIRGTDTLRVVSGGPGAGKSALLGVLVCLAHPDLAPVAGIVRSRIRGRQAPLLRGPGTIAALHARNRTLGQLLQSLTTQWALPGDAASVDDILQYLRGRQDQPILILDALDEADDPISVYWSLIRPLAEDSEQRCRVLVGVRTILPMFAPLIDGADQAGLLIDLDRAEDPQEVIDGVAGYIEDLHREAAQPGTAGSELLWQQLARQIAHTLITDPSRDPGLRVGPFLLAQLYTHQLHRAAIELDERTLSVLAGRAPRTVADALALDLNAAATVWSRPLLEAIAMARGQGMPLRLVKVVARALRPDWPDPVENELHDAFQLAEFYLRRGVDTDGEVLYRLFHESLVDALNSDPGNRW